MENGLVTGVILLDFLYDVEDWIHKNRLVLNVDKLRATYVEVVKRLK